jgi:hypothetical protein
VDVRSHHCHSAGPAFSLRAAFLDASQTVRAEIFQQSGIGGNTIRPSDAAIEQKFHPIPLIFTRRPAGYEAPIELVEL